MIAMRHGFMPAPQSMHMLLAVVGVITLGGVLFIHLQSMFIDMIAMHMVEMSVMEIIDVVAVADGGMTTACAVDMIVIRMSVTSHANSCVW